MERARAAGAKGLIMTLDWSFSNGRDWGSPAIPERMNLEAMVKFAPEGITRPKWLLEWAKTGGVPDLTTPNLTPPEGQAPTFFGAYGEWMTTPLPTWEDVAWLREQWGDAPFMLKGVMRVDDAKRAVDAGVTAISVSNHGGNNLDGTPAPIRALPAIAEAVGKDVEVLLDGGIRRGSDVVKAIALGARAVLIGRAYLWGLAANGQAGVENVLDILSGGIGSASWDWARTRSTSSPPTTSSCRTVSAATSASDRTDDMGPALTEPITLAGRTAPSRVIFGPHVTNLGDGRSFSDRHVAYYARRARGGCGIVVTETARYTPPTIPTNARRWPSAAGTVTGGSSRPAVRTGHSCSQASAIAASRVRARGPAHRCGHPRACRTR